MLCCVIVIYVILRYKDYYDDNRELRKIINEQHYYIEYYKRELEKAKEGGQEWQTLIGQSASYTTA